MRAASTSTMAPREFAESGSALGADPERETGASASAGQVKREEETGSYAPQHINIVKVVVQKFLHFYYLVLTQRSDELDGFYQEDSHVLHANVNTQPPSVVVAQGASQVKSVCDKLPYSHRVVRLHTVSFQPSAHGGICISVTGDIDSQPFVQTFMLAKQGESGVQMNFYVLNDVLTVLRASAGTATAQLDDSSVRGATIDGAVFLGPINSLEKDRAAAPAARDSTPFIDRKDPSAPDKILKTADVSMPHRAGEQLEHVGAAENVPSIAEDEAGEENNVESTAAPSEFLPAKPEKRPAKSSWASLLKPTDASPQEGAGPTPAVSETAPREGTPTAKSASRASHSGFRAPAAAVSQPVADVPTAVLWVSQLPPEAKSAVHLEGAAKINRNLSEHFARFGQVKKVDFRPAKGFAFVYMDSIASATRAKEAHAGGSVADGPFANHPIVVEYRRMGGGVSKNPASGDWATPRRYQSGERS
ncbi:putative G3BP-like protein [Porphyridium purpureum]|uniref:Putative G3BP-like protein n=1 Tax=Porphyridium purpureum TaxID=35688 RepID=A0A5J4Z4U2_PORPP|nr:putative G3BP-like protein [Porphyridium purpureum]|eukprot:POR7322..scf295_1